MGEQKAAEEETKRKAAEAARVRAAEEAKLKAEEAAKKLAEADAKLKAQLEVAAKLQQAPIVVASAPSAPETMRDVAPLSILQISRGCCNFI